jgi:hypothetical protein
MLRVRRGPSSNFVTSGSCARFRETTRESKSQALLTFAHLSWFSAFADVAAEGSPYLAVSSATHDENAICGLEPEHRLTVSRPAEDCHPS